MGVEVARSSAISQTREASCHWEFRRSASPRALTHGVEVPRAIVGSGVQVRGHGVEIAGPNAQSSTRVLRSVAPLLALLAARHKTARERCAMGRAFGGRSATEIKTASYCMRRALRLRRPT